MPLKRARSQMAPRMEKRRRWNYLVGSAGRRPREDTLVRPIALIELNNEAIQFKTVRFWAVTNASTV